MRITDMFHLKDCLPGQLVEVSMEYAREGRITYRGEVVRHDSRRRTHIFVVARRGASIFDEWVWFDDPKEMLFDSVMTCTMKP